VTQDDQQPERAPSSGMSRDTLLLLGALTFLILAVALTFLFTPNGGQNNGSATATAIASAPTEPGGPYPGAATPAEGSTGFLPTIPAYPGPGAELTASPDQAAGIPTGNPLSEASPTAESPDGASSPTADAAGGVQISPTAGEAYPGPIGEGNPPLQPTFNPTVVQPTVAPAPTFPPTSPPVAVQPTVAPAPTLGPPPTTEPSGQPAQPTDDLALDGTAAPTVVTTPAPPPPPPADVLRGNVRWGTAQSPIILKRDVQIAPGAELVIEPGVEVRLDPGVSIFVDGGRMLAMGLPDRAVRFTGNTGARWSGLFGRPGSFIVMENAEVRGGGAGGTVMAVDRSELVVRASRFNDNGGAILLTDTRLEMLNSEVSGNDMPFGAALDASYGRGNFVTMRGNRFGGNRLSDGAPQVRIANSSTFETLNLAIDGNLMRGGATNLQLTTNGPLKGDVTCNSLVGDSMGFNLRTQTPQVAPNGLPPMELRVQNNYIDGHIPPVIPVYLRYGLGRGATSEIMLDMRNNWWGEASGPYEPDQNADGRGDSVGVNILFIPWLLEAPGCAPAS
jgi:hypothetical protein